MDVFKNGDAGVLAYMCRRLHKTTPGQRHSSEKDTIWIRP